MLAFFVLYATAGVGRQMHYCKGMLKQSQLLLIADNGDGCHISTDRNSTQSCCAKAAKNTCAEKGGCCEDELVFDKLWDEFLTATNLQVPIPFLAVSQEQELFSGLLFPQASEAKDVLWRNDWQAPDPLLLHQVFRI